MQPRVYAHVDVRRLGQDALALHDERQIPRRPALRALALVDHDRVQQTLATDFRDPAALRADRLERAEAGAHLLAEALGAGRQVLVDDDFESSLSDSARERVLQAFCRDRLVSRTHAEKETPSIKLTPP